MKKIVLSTLVLAGLTITSCNNDDNVADNTSAAEYLPAKMSLSIDGESNGYDFMYDAQNRLVKVTETADVDTGSFKFSSNTTYSFEYTGNEISKVVETDYTNFNGSETNANTVYTFAKSGNTITLNYSRTSNGETSEGSESIQINDQGYLLNTEWEVYTYNAAGNLTELAGDEYRTVYEYDTKNGFLKNIKTPRWVMDYFLDFESFYVNNATKVSYTDDESPEDNEEYNVTYEYNAANYPTKMMVSGSTMTIQYNK